MSLLSNISKNRMKFSDQENKVLVKDLSTLVGNNTLNDAPPTLEGNALVATQDAKAALTALQSPMAGVTQSLNSGAAASEMMESMKNSVSSKLPDMRATSATLSGVVSSSKEYAGRMTQSVMGTVNTAMAQVPGSIGKVSQISSGVKSELLKSSVADFASKLNGTSREDLSSASNLLRSTLPLPTGEGQATRAIGAAKQSFTSRSVSDRASSKNVGLVQIAPQTLGGRITECLNSGTGIAPLEVGTTSTLLAISPPSNKVTADTFPPPFVHYDESALALIFTGVTWYRSLYTYQFEQRQEELDLNFGTGQDHYAALSLSGTPLQTEQLRNFESLVIAVTPDNPSKNQYVYQHYQSVVGLLISELPGATDPSRIQAVLAYLGQILSAFPIKPLMTGEDYDTLASAVSTLVYSAKDNSFALTLPSQYAGTYQESFSQIVTAAVVYHRGSPADFVKRPEASSEIAVFCGVWVMRSLLQAYLTTTSSLERTQLLLALEAIYILPLESLTYLYTDVHSLVHQGDAVYWKPSSRAVVELTAPLIRYYPTFRKTLSLAATNPVSPEEQTIFEALTLRLDTLMDSGLPLITQIQTELTPMSYTQLDPVYTAYGLALANAMIDTHRLVNDVSNFPGQAFEMYYTTPDHLYLDANVAFMR